MDVIQKHPCLTEKRSCTGYGGWKTSLKYKLSNYRTHLRKLGCPEVTVNSLKNKPAGNRSAAFGVKKAKRAEVNFCPAYPSTETVESLEAMQKALLLDVKKKKNREVVKVKMEKHSLTEDTKLFEMHQWWEISWKGGLLCLKSVNAEFRRITTVPLQSKFLSQLDMYSDKLMTLFQKRRGKRGVQLKTVVEQMAKCDDVDAGRECIIKGVCIYMGEDPESLVQEYVGMDGGAMDEAIEDTTVGIYVVKEHVSNEETDDIGIVLEGITVLKDLDNVALAVAMLFGLIYALNLNYPAELHYTFEVIQNIFMELDGNKLSNKAKKQPALKNRPLD